VDAGCGFDVLLQADVELGAVVHGVHGIVQLLREREQIGRMQRRRAITARDKHRVAASKRFHEQVCAGFASRVDEGI
jgi:hypothetical protein